MDEEIEKESLYDSMVSLTIAANNRRYASVAEYLIDEIEHLARKGGSSYFRYIPAAGGLELFFNGGRAAVCDEMAALDFLRAEGFTVTIDKPYNSITISWDSK
jgi:hypothetical protein